MSQIVAMWSGPRNLSTAMMRSFGSRADTAVMDEPFFAPYLAVSGKDHPGRAETLAAHETNPVKVAALCKAEVSHPYHFQKHMPHHMLEGFPMIWAAKAKHFFLIRHPQRVIASYAKGRTDFDLQDLGFASQYRLWEQLGRPPVIDSETILQAPEPALRALCKSINIPFDPAMLSWTAGARSEDGAWAPWWYANVRRSTGFGKPLDDLPEISIEHQDFLIACLQEYQQLADSALKV